jgi:hypothetical protein
MNFPPGTAAAVVAAAAQNAGLHAHHETAAPALTRLTSQVSEWLTSFWPVATRGESLTSRTALLAHAASAAPALPVAPGQVPPKGQAPVIFTVPPPEPVGPIEINTIPPMKHYQRMPHATQPLAATESTSSSTLGLDVLVQTASREDARPPPTELEQSVSTTLLSLAGTPSRLFSGISGLFGDAPEGGDNEKKLGSGKRSLLDDHEDTPEEARLRAAASLKRNKPSLLDDYDETPMEARMRSVHR